MSLMGIHFEDFTTLSGVEVSRIIVNSVREKSLKLIYGRQPNYVVFLGDGSILPVHAELLAENSYGVASSMASGQPYDLTGYDADAVRTLISFLYNGVMKIRFEDVRYLLYVAGATRMHVCAETLSWYLVHISCRSLHHTLRCAEILSMGSLYFCANCTATLRINIATLVENASNLNLLYEVLFIANSWLLAKRERFPYAEFVYALVLFKNLSTRQLIEISMDLKQELPNELYKPLLKHLKEAIYKNHVGVDVINMSSVLSFESQASFREAQSSPEIFDEILMPQNSPTSSSADLYMKDSAAENAEWNHSVGQISLVSSSKGGSSSSKSFQSPVKNETHQKTLPPPILDSQYDNYGNSVEHKRSCAVPTTSILGSEVAFISPKPQHQISTQLERQKAEKTEPLNMAPPGSSRSLIKERKIRPTDLTAAAPPYHNTEFLRATDSTQPDGFASPNQAREISPNDFKDRQNIGGTWERPLNVTQPNSPVKSVGKNGSVQSGRISLIASFREESAGISENGERDRSSRSPFGNQKSPNGDERFKNALPYTATGSQRCIHSTTLKAQSSVVSREADVIEQEDSENGRAQLRNDGNRYPVKEMQENTPLSLYEKREAETPLLRKQKRISAAAMRNKQEQLPVVCVVATNILLDNDSSTSSYREAWQADYSAQEPLISDHFTRTQNQLKSKTDTSEATELDMGTARSSDSTDDVIRTAVLASYCGHLAKHKNLVDSEEFRHGQSAGNLSSVGCNIALVDVPQEWQKQSSGQKVRITSATVARYAGMSKASSSESYPALQIADSTTKMRFSVQSPSDPKTQIESKDRFSGNGDKQMMGNECRIIRRDTMETMAMKSKYDLKTAKEYSKVDGDLTTALSVKAAKRNEKTKRDLGTVVNLKTSVDNREEDMLLRTALEHDNDCGPQKGQRSNSHSKAGRRDQKNGSVSNENNADKMPASDKNLKGRDSEESDEALKTVRTTSSLTESDLLEKTTSTSFTI